MNIKEELKSISLGKLHAWWEIAMNYYSRVFQVITAFGVLKLLGVPWYILAGILFLLVPGVVVVVYLHMKYVYPTYSAYIWDRNPSYREMKKKIMEQ